MDDNLPNDDNDVHITAPLIVVILISLSLSHADDAWTLTRTAETAVLPLSLVSHSVSSSLKCGSGGDVVEAAVAPSVKRGRDIEESGIERT